MSAISERQSQRKMQHSNESIWKKTYTPEGSTAFHFY